jgi:hypothetical protein
MPLLLNATPLQKARVTVPRHGVWEGVVTTTGTLDLALGAAVTLTLGDLTLSGYVADGGTFPGASESTYVLAGGAAGWTATVPAKGHQVPTSVSLPGGGGVKLVDVVAALAADAGETFDLSQLSPSATLGDHWQRPAGVASVALSALFPLAAGGWRVDPDGQTRPGPRPHAPLPRDLELAVEDADPARRWARVGVKDDRLSALLPGAVLVAPNLAAPLVVGELQIRGAADRIEAEVLGEGGLVEMLASLVLAIVPPAPLSGEYRYQVAGADAGAPNLTALVPGCPPTLACAKVYGVPGVTATLAPGSVVLVSFLDGSPARPMVTGYVNGTPQALSLDAATTITAGAGGAPLVKDGPLQAWIAALASACAPHGITVPALTGEATTKLLGA